MSHDRRTLKILKKILRAVQQDGPMTPVIRAATLEALALALGAVFAAAERIPPEERPWEMFADAALLALEEELHTYHAGLN